MADFTRKRRPHNNAMNRAAQEAHEVQHAARGAAGYRAAVSQSGGAEIAAERSIRSTHPNRGNREA